MSARRPKSKPLPKWTPFRRTELKPIEPGTVEGIAKAFPNTSRAHIEAVLKDVDKDKVFLNSRYQVNVRPFGPEGQQMVHLSIKRLDKDRVGPERYRDFMRIKNELVGPEFEAVEIYPAHSREVDTANQYHLWVMPPGVSVPFGFDDGRAVQSESLGGARQHPLEEEN